MVGVSFVLGIFICRLSKIRLHSCIVLFLIFYHHLQIIPLILRQMFCNLDHSTVRRVTRSGGRIDTIDSPDDKNLVARNM